MGLLTRLRGKASPVTDDPLSDLRHECFSFHTILVSLRDDAKQLIPIMQDVATKESKSTNLAKTLLESRKACWGEFDDVVNKYAEGYSNVLRFYESVTRPQIEKLVFDVENNETATADTIKKIEARDALHQKLIETGQEMEKLLKAGKSITKTELAKTKLTDEFSKSTTDLEAKLNLVLKSRKEFMATSLNHLITIQAAFYEKLAENLTPLKTNTLVS